MKSLLPLGIIALVFLFFCFRHELSYLRKKSEEKERKKQQREQKYLEAFSKDHPEKEEVTCGMCNTSSSPTVNFCSNCGADLQEGSGGTCNIEEPQKTHNDRICTTCSNEIPTESEFCINCKELYLSKDEINEFSKVRIHLTPEGDLKPHYQQIKDNGKKPKGERSRRIFRNIAKNIAVICSIWLGLVLLFDVSPPGSSKTYKSTQPHTILSARDNLGAWRQASYSQNNSLCNSIIRNVQEPGVTVLDLSNCISEAANDGNSDHLQIADVATACIIMLR